MKIILLPLSLLALAPSATAQSYLSQPAATGFSFTAPEVRYAGASRLKAKASAPLFTAEIPEAQATVWSENFDNGTSGWTIDPTSNVIWSTKTTTGDKAFSTINPDDKGSLYVEGPYAQFRREISSATSAAFTVPYSARLTMWVGMTTNYDDYCRLIVSVSDDDFATSTEVWNSKDAQGERPWAWRNVEADLSQWEGKTLRLRLTYSWGAKDEGFNTGGYMGDFTIDDIKVSGIKAIDHVDLTTGEKLRLICLNPAAGNLKWSFPGGTPAESTEASPEVHYTADGTYAISLTATVAGEEVESTVEGFVTVTGTAPVAHILPPATFRDATSHNHMVAPLAPVTFRSASEGYPDESVWVFSGVTDGQPDAMKEITGTEATVSFMYQHSWPVGLAVANEYGSSNDLVTVAAEFEGGINNLLGSDIATTFDMSDWGVFPGSNTRRITRYAEHFSAPSVPMIVGGAFLYFVDKPSAVAVTDNSSIGVHLYTCENGVPGKCIDSYWWSVIDLNGPTADGTLQGTFFEFLDVPVVTDEFFIVVDGLPEYREAGKDGEDDPGCKVSFAMARQRAGGNTAYMEIGGKWRPVEGYFEAGKGTSFFITPVVRHSVMTSLPAGNDEITVPYQGGDTEHQIFSYMGWKTPVESDADWCEVTNKPTGDTVDKLIINCQPNTSDTGREAHLTLTDGVGSLRLTVRQASSSGIADIQSDAPGGDVRYFNLQGIRVTRPVAGQIYIRHTSAGTEKVRF